ncbi:MAG TPA: hypothetical protein VGH28_13730 [Polyangiaceae bacterium]
MRVIAFLAALALAGCSPAFHHFVGDGVTPGTWGEGGYLPCLGYAAHYCMSTSCERGGCVTTFSSPVVPKSQPLRCGSATR